MEEFGKDDDSPSDEQSGRRPRRNQMEDNRQWESRMRVNIPDFAGDTLSPEGFIDWLVAVEEVAEDSEIPEAMIPLLEEFSDVFPDEPHYKISPGEHEEVRRQVEELVSKGYVCESISQCVVPALLTPKKDGTWRICVDSQAINKITVRRSIPNFSSIMALLTDCMKGKSFVWTKEAELAFQVIKEKLTTTPILVLPNFSKVFKLYTDASKVAIGGVLSHGRRHVAYFSEKLTEPKSRYTTYDLKFYVVVQAVKHWRHHLFHKEFVLFTNHDSLRHIRTQDKVASSSSELTCLASSELVVASYRSDTGPPMLDRTDFVLWQQRIRLYCREKENGINILK
ncbi:putative reverse transcriptase domain-containing protein, partial [Tanacetum coccineum]